jgi:hypothetical protein
MHVVYNAQDNVPLQAERVLGHSAMAIVEAVRCRGRLLARKSISMNRRLKQEIIISEVGMLQKLRHRHIVQVIGSYTQRKTLSTLNYPVADCTLSDMIDDVEGNNQSAQSHRIALKRFFACLAQAVE